MSFTCCSTQSPHRASRQRLRRRARVSASDEARHGWLPHPPEPVGQAAGAGLAAARTGAHALTHPREALERSREVVDLLVRDELIAAPRSSLNVPIGATRRIATAHVELQELQNVRSALGGKVNDVVLCAATGALRELLLARGEDPPHQGLRVMVPVNIRREGAHGELGNKVSSLFVEIRRWPRPTRCAATSKCAPQARSAKPAGKRSPLVR